MSLCYARAVSCKQHGARLQCIFFIYFFFFRNLNFCYIFSSKNFKSWFIYEIVFQISQNKNSLYPLFDIWKKYKKKFYFVLRVFKPRLTARPRHVSAAVLLRSGGNQWHWMLMSAGHVWYDYMRERGDYWSNIACISLPACLPSQLYLLVKASAPICYIYSPHGFKAPSQKQLKRVSFQNFLIMTSGRIMLFATRAIA